ncbi:hypothetical protein C8R44DRAFT_752217 [Mycena epipterygia]|nr:hypothetical protein C8R44DRAFT_752217 [Mycena epipterygia]
MMGMTFMASVQLGRETVCETKANMGLKSVLGERPVLGQQQHGLSLTHVVSNDNTWFKPGLVKPRLTVVSNSGHWLHHGPHHQSYYDSIIADPYSRLISGAYALRAPRMQDGFNAAHHNYIRKGRPRGGDVPDFTLLQIHPREGAVASLGNRQIDLHSWREGLSGGIEIRRDKLYGFILRVGGQQVNSKVVRVHGEVKRKEKTDRTKIGLGTSRPTKPKRFGLFLASFWNPPRRPIAPNLSSFPPIYTVIHATSPPAEAASSTWTPSARARRGALDGPRRRGQHQRVAFAWAWVPAPSALTVAQD